MLIKVQRGENVDCFACAGWSRRYEDVVVLVTTDEEGEMREWRLGPGDRAYIMNGDLVTQEQIHGARRGAPEVRR